jgi:transcription termination factor Rho
MRRKDETPEEGAGPARRPRRPRRTPSGPAPRAAGARRRRAPRAADDVDAARAEETRAAAAGASADDALDATDATGATGATGANVDRDDAGDVGARPPQAAGIPPLPDDDDFVPIEDDEPGPATAPPPGATPPEVLAGVRRGDLHVSALSSLSTAALEGLARDAGVAPRAPEERANDFLYRLLQARPEAPRPKPFPAEGLLEVLPDGLGFLRRPETSYAPAPSDVLVPPALVSSLGLLPGHWVSGPAWPPRRGERYAVLAEVEEVNHEDPDVLRRRVPFDELTVVFPDQRLLLETTPEEVSMRIMDLFCPVGRGQRGLIVSPPRAGKTIILQRIADAVARNSPSTEIVVLLVDERPEEVTSMRRSVRGEVLASTFDQPAHRHVRLAELTMEKVKRLVELGRHVLLLIDSMTRLGRAYNNEAPTTGRLLTGGMDAKALTKPKRFFSSARNVEDGGSLTILATALVDTGSRLDQVVFEEFKGTGNMELVLSRDLANQRLWPAIDIPKSGTRNEELLLHPEEQRRITALRRAMADEPPAEVLEDILEKMKKFKTNAEFLMNVAV